MKVEYTLEHRELEVSVSPGGQYVFLEVSNHNNDKCGDYFELSPEQCRRFIRQLEGCLARVEGE